MPSGEKTPTKYTPELAAFICEQLSKGRTLRAICRDLEALDGPADSTVRQWVMEDVNGFHAQYAKARDTGLDAMSEECFDIADDKQLDTITKRRDDGTEFETINTEWIARSRLRVDTRKWYLSKLAPKRYGEKLTTEISGPDGGPIKVQDPDRAAKLLELFAAIGQRATDDVV